MKTFEGKLVSQNIKVGIVAARFNEFITSKLLSGAMDGLLRHDVQDADIHVAWVPGAFEIPLVASKMAKSGKYDAVICLGAVIRGSTSHYDYVCNEVSKGIATVSLESGVPVLFGVLTTENIEQAIERAGTKAGNKGYDCAGAANPSCRTMLNLQWLCILLVQLRIAKVKSLSLSVLYSTYVLKKSDAQYAQLKAGSLGSYDFIRAKIKKLEITPGELGLEPSTGSLVMTDPNNGDVLACVSYPGYDNNKLANTMDSNYYSKLLNDSSRPLYNSATQEKTAPGSTYKPLSAIAGLSEGVITPSSIINCSGIYKKVTPNPKCWAYPSAHGSLNVSQAIQHSCNSFFYEVGYRLSLKQNGLNQIQSDNAEGKATSSYYSSDRGLNVLKKYAKKFGLGSTSGIEIPEAQPQISDDSSVPSAIGQGTNNYTTSQLARYITTVANKGTVYNLTVLDKVTNVKGKRIKSYKAKVKNKITDVPNSTWSAVHTGMRNVVLLEHNDIFSSLNHTNLAISGKTGTAQQGKTHPDHGLFVGFAPSNSPEVAWAIRIANGYSSSRAAEVGRDVMKYYYNKGDKKKIITGEAATIGSGSGGD